MNTDTAAAYPTPTHPHFSLHPPGVIATRRLTDGTGDKHPNREGPNRGGRNQIMDELEEVVAEDRLLLRIEEAAKRLGIGRSTDVSACAERPGAVGSAWPAPPYSGGSAARVRRAVAGRGVGQVAGA